MRKYCACDTKNAHKKPDGANHPVLLFGIGKNVRLKFPAIAEMRTDRLRRRRIRERA